MAILFISHASQDHSIADRMCADLESDGLSCWIAPRNVPAGADYAKVIPQFIESSEILVLLLSSASNASEHVGREVHLAAAVRKPIIPVRLEPIEPEAALAFFLADKQRIDAFPRLEPQLAHIRGEVRRTLAEVGRVIPPVKRSPFRRVFVTAGSWLMVFALVMLAVILIQGMWFNLVPTWRVPVVVLQRSPAILLALAVLPLSALSVQYWANRSFRQIATLDALFSASAGTSARWRLGGAAVLCAVLLTAIVSTPRTVAVMLKGGPVNQRTEGLIRIVSCPNGNYAVQDSSHYVIRLRVGRLNPAGRYALRIQLAKYATPDGARFCEIWLDQRLGTLPDQRWRVMSDERNPNVGFVQVNASLESLVGVSDVVLTVAHYHDSHPAPDTELTATLSLEGSLSKHDEQKLSSSLWSDD